MDGDGSGTLWIMVALGVAALGAVMAWRTLRQRQQPKNSAPLERAERAAVKEDYRDDSTR